MRFLFTENMAKVFQISQCISVRFDGQQVIINHNGTDMMELEVQDYDEIVDSQKIDKYIKIVLCGRMDEILRRSEEDPYVNCIEENTFTVQITDKLSFKFRTENHLTTVHVLYKNAKCACSWERMDFFLEEFMEFLSIRDELFGECADSFFSEG